MNININIFQSLIIRIHPEYKELQEESIHFINSLKQLKKIDLHLSESFSSEMSVNEVKKKSSKLNEFWQTNKKYIGGDDFIYRFSINVMFPPDFIDEFEKNNEIDIDTFISVILINEIKKRFYEFLMILNICKVGGCVFGLGCLEINDKLFKLKRINFAGYELFEYSMEKKWPNFESLEIQETWNWYLRKVNPIRIDELSSSPLSRAFNAFSYLYDESDDITKLFWTMVGLEAIYVEGIDGISRQIREKGQLFLGEIEEFKKRLSRMYDFRSGFVHGSINFPSFFHIDNEMDSFLKYCEDSFEVLLTAESMLITTLQKMAKKDLGELKFKYILE